VENLGYEFKNRELLELALTQSGVDCENNNERLEFIGDRVLGLTVALMLYDMFPSESEGELARRHAFLVSTDTLADVATEIGLEHHLRCGHVTAGRIRHLLADAMEAVFGAIMIDGGFDAARVVIDGMWRARAAHDVVAPKDAKSALQEFVQKNSKGILPKYTYFPQTGAPHSPVFTVRVSAMGKSVKAKGPSKKQASLNAAAELLKILDFSGNDS